MTKPGFKMTKRDDKVISFEEATREQALAFVLDTLTADNAGDVLEYMLGDNCDEAMPKDSEAVVAAVSTMLKFCNKQFLWDMLEVTAGGDDFDWALHSSAG